MSWLGRRRVRECYQPRRRAVPALLAIPLLVGSVLPSATACPAGARTPPKTEAAPPTQAEPSKIRFEDIAEAAGVEFESVLSPDKRFILESVSGGVAIFDFDRDERPDIFLVDSLTVATADRKELARNALYRNLGNGKFEDVAAAMGVAETGWGVGVCVADYDGDGFQDLYLTGVVRNHLFRNRQGKGFEDVTLEAGVRGGGWSTGCGFADVDRDGDLDLFVARYLDLDLRKLPAFGEGELCRYREIPVQCGPRGLPGKPDLFYRNLGNGKFEEAGKAVGLGDPDALFGLGVSWLDVDDDGWPDLYVANDTNANHLYMNQKDGTFEEMAHLMGAAVTEDGKEQGSMGIAVGDYLNDGWPSLFVTNFSEEYNAFYRNMEGGYFTDVSFRTQTAPPSLRYVGWGTSFLDADNDGWLDLVLLNGHVYPQIDQIDLEASAPYLQRRLFYRNRQNGRFEEIAESIGGAMAAEKASRGLAVGDLDGDGRLDLVINDLDGKAEILRNTTADVGHWLIVKLEGRPPLTDAIGARIRVRIGETTLTRWVRSGTSYLSQDDFRQHFGLGEAGKVDSIEVRWPDGNISQHGAAEADRVLTLRQPEPPNRKSPTPPAPTSEGPEP